MNILPPDLMPPGFGVVQHEQAAAPRRLNHEENINRQVQLITFLRSTGQPYAEAVLSLRSLCIGLEDKHFMEAWEAWPCHATMRNGVAVWEPTNEDAADAFNILMALLSRWGMTFKARIVSKVPPLPSRTLTPSMQAVVDEVEKAGPEGEA